VIFARLGAPWPFWAAGGVMALSLLLAARVVRGAARRQAGGAAATA